MIEDPLEFGVIDPFPDLFVPLLGWRAWKVSAAGVLRAWTFNTTEWKPMEEMSCRTGVPTWRSRCSPPVFDDLDLGGMDDDEMYDEGGLHYPTLRCRCGVHAFKHYQTLEQQLAREWGPISQGAQEFMFGLPNEKWKHPAETIVVGRVAMRGHYVEGEVGFRAEYAYPYDLYVINGDQALARKLSDLYKVDATVSLPNVKALPSPPPVPPKWLACNRNVHQWHAERDECVWCGKGSGTPLATIQSDFVPVSNR